MHREVIQIGCAETSVKAGMSIKNDSYGNTTPYIDSYLNVLNFKLRGFREAIRNY